LAVLRLLGILLSGIRRIRAMCFGGSSGPSAEELYQKRKPVFGDLPSLDTGGEKVDRESGLKDVPKMRTGTKQRSLLMMEYK